MAERTVTVIPPSVNHLTKVASATESKRKTAGYARVSTDTDEQFTSYEAQVDYYTRFIKSRTDWEFVNVYTDEGISGLNTKNRDGFNQMISDALSGKIDLIITKSVSRFARNTVDSLVTIRKLKENGVEVFFEKENIYTFDGKGELLLTIMSSLAQEESRSISENVTWGQRKRFSDGKLNLPYKRFLGYDRGADKDSPPVINAEQAEIVRRIYRYFMNGMSFTQIATSLTSDGIPTPTGKIQWHPSTISGILKNEKYRGSARLQKKYTVDFLTRKSKKNEGEVPQYYIEHSHEPIIPPEEWDAVQDELERRKKNKCTHLGNNALCAKLACGDCGAWYGPKVWHSNSKYRTIVWFCNARYAGEHRCTTPNIKEADVKERFLKVYNNCIENRDEILSACQIAKKIATNTSKIESQLAELDAEMAKVTELTQACVKENSFTVQNQLEYAERYNGYITRYEKAKAQYEELLEKRKAMEAKSRAIDRFIEELKKRSEILTAFDEKLWVAVIDKATVRNNGIITFRFQDGTEIDG